jgi:putative ABC transport system permease protein
MGIRIALGASPRGVLRLMVVQALRPVLIGLSVGLLAALAVSKILESVLFGISTHDAIAFVGAGVFLLAVALLATWIPSRRVIRLDPLKTLRYE